MKTALTDKEVGVLLELFQEGFNFDDSIGDILTHAYILGYNQGQTDERDSESPLASRYG